MGVSSASSAAPLRRLLLDRRPWRSRPPPLLPPPTTTSGTRSTAARDGPPMNSATTPQCSPSAPFLPPISCAPPIHAFALSISPLTCPPSRGRPPQRHAYMTAVRGERSRRGPRRRDPHFSYTRPAAPLVGNVPLPTAAPWLPPHPARASQLAPPPPVATAAVWRASTSGVGRRHPRRGSSARPPTSPPP